MTTHEPRLALVTGTSSGIGTALARGLLEHGWTVVGLSRRAAAIDDVAYRHVATDLADLSGLAALGESELAPLLADPRWRRVGVVNNAAATGDMRPMEQADPLAVAQAFVTNVVAPMYLMGLALRKLPAATPLRIVNVSTGAAVRAFPGLGEYGSSKAALRMASMIQAEELASAERPGGPRPATAILSYSPGVVDTPMQEMARQPGRAWNGPFVEFHAQGMLQPPQAPAAEIRRFLEADGGAPFAEARFGENAPGST